MKCKVGYYSIHTVWAFAHFDTLQKYTDVLFNRQTQSSSLLGAELICILLVYLDFSKQNLVQSSIFISQPIS